MVFRFYIDFLRLIDKFSWLFELIWCKYMLLVFFVRVVKSSIHWDAKLDTLETSCLRLVRAMTLITKKMLQFL